MQQDAFENIVSKVVAILRRLQWDKTNSIIRHERNLIKIQSTIKH